MPPVQGCPDGRTGGYAVNSRLVEVANLLVRFPVRMRGRQTYIQPVAGVSFDQAPGESIALVGESGSGKTTVGKALVRTVEPSGGRIVVEGRDVTHVRGRELREYRNVAQMIFQDPFGSLNPVKTVEQHLSFPTYRKTGLKGADCRRQVASLLEQVGLTPARNFLTKYPHELSGGQRQRLSIARALALAPKLIVADEPVSMLDVSIRAGILKLMKDLQTELGLSYLFITHDLASARYFGDRIMVLYGGKMMEMAPSRELVRRAQHPYTRLLLAATPGSGQGGALPETTNEPPDLSVERRGCPFAHRCPLAEPRCRSEEPELRELAPGHFAACHLL